jgi:hypothetical protein
MANEIKYKNCEDKLLTAPQHTHLNQTAQDMRARNKYIIFVASPKAQLNTCALILYII